MTIPEVTGITNLQIFFIFFFLFTFNIILSFFCCSDIINSLKRKTEKKIIGIEPDILQYCEV